MDQTEAQKKINSLPIRQQIGLWTILRIPNVENKNFSFKSSTFKKEMEPHLIKSEFNDNAEYGRYVGGILSGLSRNKILLKISNDRDPLWILTDNIKKNQKIFKDLLFAVKTYWPQSY